MRVLMTGAAGIIGTVLTKGLSERHEIHGLDIDQMPLLDHKTVGDVSDFDKVLDVSRGMDAIIHLTTAKPDQKDWEGTVKNSMRGTHNVFEAAVQNGVKRVVYASRAAVVDQHPKTTKRTMDLYPLPDSLYTISKIFAEGMARMYTLKQGLETVGVRIGNLKAERPVPEDQPKHLSHGDCVRLFERAIIHPDVEWELVYGVSDCNWKLYDLEHGFEAIGYYPQDSSFVPEDSIPQ